MATGGRISMLVSRDLQTLVQAAKQLDPEVRKQLRAHTRRVVDPAFHEEIRERGSTRLQQRALVTSARVAVSDTNVTLKAGGVGKLSSGTTVSTVSAGAEFGMPPGRPVTQRSKRGKTYTRTVGGAFGPRRQRGNVFFPAVKAFIPRAASLWIQTAYRTTAETFEKVM